MVLKYLVIVNLGGGYPASLTDEHWHYAKQLS